ncbi:2-oxoglutarate dehydrogenase E1 component [Kingella kingae]|uniref:2-oxoglutarate dehydrogenase E1 component n=2 Tax=Kingella kingae TaxID=504 RepID=F5S738_KINKI|nr:2-oxoglutarate dehydrogenase E1 component [Kingella kingae]EGK09357.1 2-oxoglutarate dehydrogenase E1 component [Kingella kingae ATCC 23330]MDK4533589.1 2-oxoglutarate dehydrogenase E1 component [Kingella kingae]MDK4540098.1 2-oxoglutarate dehydrogenase E1 component [Kingella kingae]MDK4552586.1 2-oxoglutarate dehydrogenase E1 component [Kingella kingae]MDK4612456.1 2-oxoglutarate dehydrogenase E1 component [Kingella kingae]
MMNEKLNFSYLFGSNAPYIEELYENYLDNPHSVGEVWQQYFRELAAQPGAVERDVAHYPIQQSFANLAKRQNIAAVTGNIDENLLQKQIAVLRLISAYRIQGSGAAKLDPLGLKKPRNADGLSPEAHGLSNADMAVQFSLGEGDFGGATKLTLADIISKLQQTYCGHIGVEYMYIENREERQWIRNYFESRLSTPKFSADEKRYILKQLTASETLERYLHTKYVGQKRFSVEGGESAIAGLNYLVQNAGKDGVEEIIIGMAHRGRLNVLVNTLGKQPADLFAEFEGRYDTKLPSGDVKYHNGYNSDIATPHGAMHVTLAFNPSHLEIVNPVVEGSARAKQRRRGLDGRDQVLPVLIHGDSAFIGLGVNQATFNMSRTRGYSTGGTVHMVINNQIGFTTSDTRDTRSTVYCTDIAKMVEAPVFHVNGDDPEAVCFVVQAALDYRKQFHKDVVIDVVCFRKLGHNEGDDPTLTQPLMYRAITKHPGTRALYAEKLVKEGVLSADDAEGLVQAYRAALDKGEHVEQTRLTDYESKHRVDWSKYQGQDWREAVESGLPAADIQRLTDKFTQVPEGFGLHNTAKRVIEQRKEMAAGKQPFDWGMAETVAYASMVTNGTGVRISGEDSGRGTFSHRHAVLHDTNRATSDTGIYTPLEHMADNQADFVVIDSILNEEAVMAYEYGYACSAPDKLVIWEAQFGDFANGAQVAIDQFISSGETKWGRLCGLTTILPHGYDGQGPEHSSGRLERWLQLCSEHNMQVIMPSEASQMFHILRRQTLRSYRKPLVIFMSKRLLRFKDSMSPLENFLEGTTFRPVISDVAERADNASVKRVIMCAGQVYYDLAKARDDAGLQNEIAIVRAEQLYPFPYAEAEAELAKFPNATEILWAQEEPKNQGAWYQTRHRLERLAKDGQTVRFAGRPASASPAVGYASKHKSQLEQLIADALNLN